MDRKQFLKKTLQAGLCGCAAASALLAKNLKATRRIEAEADHSQPEQEWIPELEKKMIRGAESPDWNKVEKTGRWIKDLMDHMDTFVDAQTRITLMQACGRSCYINAFGIASAEKPLPAAAEQFMKYLSNGGYEVRQEGRKTVVIYNWGRKHQNPWGLIIQDGYCMCPIVESSPQRLSPTYCLCSTGYIKEIFERNLGKPVTVELLESLKTGGKDCRFRIEL